MNLEGRLRPNNNDSCTPGKRLRSALVQLGTSPGFRKRKLDQLAPATN